MAAPITSQPIISYSTAAGPGSVYFYRERTKQARPYNLATAAVTERNRTTLSTAYGFYTPQVSWASASATSTWPKMGSGFGRLGSSYDKELFLSQSVNLARDKFIGTIREEAMLAVNYAERKQAVDMITNRAAQLARFARAVKRGRLDDIAGALHLRSTELPKGVKYRRTRSAADTFLELHFGWAPLVSDIWTACHLLARDPPALDLKTWSRKVVIQTSDVEKGSGYTLFKNFDGYTRAYMGGRVSVTNPNLWLLNQLGLLNPLGVLWELTPWSFVVDWFYNVGDWLNQLTDFAGLTVHNAWYSTIVRGTTDVMMVNGNSGYHVVQQGSWFTRKTGIPGVTLGKIPYKPLSLARGATAVSLLVQQLPSRGLPTSGRKTFTPKWAS